MKKHTIKAWGVIDYRHEKLSVDADGRFEIYLTRREAEEGECTKPDDSVVRVTVTVEPTKKPKKGRSKK